jgi:hypothetical protein
MLALLALPAVAGPLPVTSVSASSTYPKENGVSYIPDHLVDGRVTTVWIEGERASGLGSWVQLELGEARAITHLRIRNGNAGSAEENAAANQASAVTLTFEDGTEALTLAATPEVQDLTFAAHTSRTVKLTVTAVT